MKDRKHELLDVALFDYQYIQRHLTEMAARGWRLEKIGSFGVWHYRRAEPASVRYEVTFAPSASAYNSRPTEDEEALSDLCADAGWTRVATAAQLHVYCNADPNATPIETDEATRIATIRKTMNRHFVPQYLLLTALFVVQLFMQLSTVTRYPVTSLSSPLMIGNLLFLPVAIVSYLVMIAGYFLWIRKAQQAAESGQTVPECVFYRRFRWVLWAVLAVYLSSLLLSSGLGIAALVLSYAAVTLGLVGVTMSITKDAGAPKWANILVPFVVTFVGLMLLSPLLFGILDAASLAEEPEHPATMPLMISHLTEADNVQHSIMEDSASLVMSHTRYWDHEEVYESGLSLSYSIVDTEFDFAWEMCLNYYEQQLLESSYTLSNGVVTGNLADQWGAEYARRAPGDFNDRWLICWEDRVVSLRASWPLTDEQIAIAAELLKP